MQLLLAQTAESSVMSSADIFALAYIAACFLIYIFAKIMDAKSASIESYVPTDSGRQLMEPVPEFHLRINEIQPDDQQG